MSGSVGQAEHAVCGDSEQDRSVCLCIGQRCMMADRV